MVREVRAIAIQTSSMLLRDDVVVELGMNNAGGQIGRSRSIDG